MSIVCDLYCRVSTQGQAQDGYSIGEQEERLRAYAQANGWAINAVLVDGGFTGKNMNRPGLQSLIEDAQAKRIHKVVVYKMDRLSRSQKEMLYLIEDVFLANGVDFVSTTETLDTSTPIGMAMIGILSAFAQLEREQIKERMMLGRTARAREGLYHGGGNNPFGYTYDKSKGLLIPNPAEADMVRHIFDMYLSGETATGIAKKMNLEYHTRNRAWASTHITRILRCPTYIGMFKWKDEIYKAEGQEPIVDKAVFDAVQKMLDRRCAPKGTIRPQSPYKHTALLGGMLYCAKCGNRYTTFKDPCWERTKVMRYYCLNRTSYGRIRGVKCMNKGWRADTLDSIIVNEIRKLHADRSLMSDKEARVSRLETEKAEITKRIADLGKRYERLLDLYEYGTLDAPTWSKRADAITKDKAELEKKLQSLQEIPRGLSSNEVESMLESFADLVDNAGEGYMKLYPIVHELIRSIQIDDENIDITWNFE